MKKIKGTGVFGAIALGSISVFRRRETAVRRIHTESPEAEKSRLEAARSVSKKQLEAIHEKALREVGEANAQIFEIHIMMLDDEDFVTSVNSVIETQSVNAEYAVAVTADNFAEMFASAEDAYMQARAADVRDISDRLIANLGTGADKVPEIGGKVIICADDLAPSETVLLDKERVLAFVTAFGSSNSHTAILAGSMNIPAVVGAGEELLDSVRDGMSAAVDGYTGEIVLEPDDETAADFRRRQSDDLERKRLLQELKGMENITLDGTKIGLYANIGSVNNIGDVLAGDADGIGLFRSEFLYLGRSEAPSEQEQFTAYKKVLESMAGKRVIIRTLDIGADKQADCFSLAKEENPALGCRAIRLCLTHPDIFRTQLRALLRASAFGRLGIMFPMITSVSETEKCLEMLESVKNELAAEGIPCSDSIETGIMIETPAAAVISDRLAPLVDFFSVGTNDLIQYTLACDRQNDSIAPFVDTHHEAVLRLIRLAAENAHSHGKWIGICGELAADTSLTEEFLRMGIDELSVSPHLVLSVRSEVRSIRLQ